MSPRHLRIGTRGSPMALRQTVLVRDRHPRWWRAERDGLTTACSQDGWPRR